MKRRNASVQVGSSRRCSMSKFNASRICCDINDVIGKFDRPDKWKVLIAHRPGEIAVPFLPLLADMDHVQEIWAELAKLRASNRTKVRDWQCFDRRLLQEQVADRRICSLSEAFQLLKRRLLGPLFP